MRISTLQSSTVLLIVTLLVIPYAAMAGSDEETTGGIRYEVLGSGEPVLLIHGAYMEDALVPIMHRPELSGFQLVHYHRRGYGGSVGHDGELSIDQEAADAVALLDELSISKVHVVGYSSGGVIAYKLAVAYPGRVATVSLIEPALQLPGSSEQDMPPFLLEAFTAYESGDIDRAVDTFQSFVGSPDWQSNIDSALSNGLDQINRNTQLFFELEAPAVLAFPFSEADARMIQNPVLYFVSDSGAPGSVELRELVKDWIPQTTEVLIDNADHTLPLMQPGPIAKAIAEFVAASPID